jgi:hypothetical protein
MQKILDQITSDTRQALGDNLISLVLYGSHARDEAHERSDINLFIVVRDSHAAALEPLLRCVPGWIKKGAAAPVIFEEAQLARSQDTFALELAEMACVHRVLDGRDPFDGFQADWKEVRNELEHETRQKTIYLKRRWLASGGNLKAYRALIIETVPGFLALLRGALMLHRKAISPLKVSMILEELKSWDWFKSEVWRKLSAAAKGKEKLSDTELAEILPEYIEQARAFVRFIDRMPDES